MINLIVYSRLFRVNSVRYQAFSERLSSGDGLTAAMHAMAELNVGLNHVYTKSGLAASKLHFPF